MKSIVLNDDKELEIDKTFERQIEKKYLDKMARESIDPPLICWKGVDQ